MNVAQGATRSAHPHRGRRSSPYLTLSIIALAALMILASLTASPSAAAEPTKMFRVGIAALANPRSAPFFVAFEERLQKLGYVEGNTLAVDFVSAEGKIERLPAAMAELVRRKVDVIVVGGSEVILKGAKAATPMIPIVMIAVDFDPLAHGYVASLARPRGNITGVFLQPIELAAKRLDLLKQTIPDLARVIVFWDATSADQFEATVSAAQSLQLPLKSIELREPPYDYVGAPEGVNPRPGDALLFTSSGFFFRDRDHLAELLLRWRLPSMVGAAWRESGGLISYGTSVNGMYRLAADYVDKILKGAAPADLPIEQPTRFELVVNLKTARALGLTIPLSILGRADEVIE
jgi:putative tryptophan/tyrosine transport system substrate-binding protein